MKKALKLIIIFIVLTLVVGAIYIGTYIKYDNTIINKPFVFMDSFTNELVESEYYYSDSYFSKESSKENEHLSTFAFSLALSFTPVYTEDNINKYIQDIFEGIGLKDYKYYDDEIITKDTIGTALAHKKLNNKYELVVLVLRGADYEDEWLSNFDIGSVGNVKGFDDSAKVVLDRLSIYLKDNNIDKYKLLVTGYSRAGAIANIVGVTLNEETSYHINPNDLYVYTFEAAKGTNNNKVYSNIHNIVNKNDLIPYFYQEQLNIYNNGNIIDITDNDRTINRKCFNIFAKDKVIDNGQISKQEFLKEFISLFPSEREEYVKLLSAIKDIYVLINNKDNNQLYLLFKYISDNMTNDIDLKEIISILSSDNDKKVNEIYSKVTDNYDNNYKSINNILSKEEYSNLKNDIYIILKFFLPLIKNDFSYKVHGEPCSMYNTLTFIYNIEDIIKEHSFTNNYNLVKSKDSYYK